MPKGMHHHAWAKGPTIVRVHGIGPFAFTYVDPGDDPRNKHLDWRTSRGSKARGEANSQGCQSGDRG